MNQQAHSGETMTSEFIRLLGRDIASPEVQESMRSFGLTDIYDDPPFRRYISAKAKGISILFEDDHLIDIQIYVRPTKQYSEVAEPLPFGIKRGMNQADVHQYLRPPVASDEF